MTFLNFLYVFGFLCSLTIMAVAGYARCWLLLFGMLLRVPMDIQVIVLKFDWLLGGHSGAPSRPLVLFNRAMEMAALMIVTVATIRILYRFAILQRHASQFLSQAERGDIE